MEAQRDDPHLQDYMRSFELYIDTLVSIVCFPRNRLIFSSLRCRDYCTYREDVRLVRAFASDNTEVINCNAKEISPNSAEFVLFSRLAFYFVVALDRVLKIKFTDYYSITVSSDH